MKIKAHGIFISINTKPSASTKVMQTIQNKTDVRCLQAYKHRVLEGCSYRTPSTSVFDSV